MSRGPGSLQREIIKHLRARGGQSTLESIRWELHGQSNAGCDLPKATAFAVTRAVRSLASVAQGKRLIIEKRSLANLEEWVAHYPNKTRRNDIRQMRIELLPVLVTWLRSAGGPGPLYTPDDNERFYARREEANIYTRMSQPDRGTPFASEWRALEVKLRPHLARSSSDDLFYLVARGKMVFLRGPIETRASFGDLFKRCADQKLLPPELLAELQSLSERFLSPEQAGALQLKSWLYRCVTSVIMRHPELKPEAIDALYAARPEYLKTLPGYEPQAKKRARGLWIAERRWGNVVARGSLLARLIDQTTFQKLNFVRLAN